MEQTQERNRQARAVWAAGDFDVIAQLIREVGDRIVERLDVQPGEEVLDVACGTGNTTIPAAQRGARTVGVDITPELFVAARKHAAEAGVTIDWVEGDAEALPFDDASFDVVLSTFGCMFAPRQDVTAREIARVVRPGGRFGICSWTAQGAVGDFFRTVAGHMPPPPEPFSPPALWGDEEHVRRLFADSGVSLEFAREEVTFEFDSPEHATQTYERYFGPLIMARNVLEPQGKWQALRDDLLAFFERHAPDGTYDGGYLVAVGRRSA